MPRSRCRAGRWAKELPRWHISLSVLEARSFLGSQTEPAANGGDAGLMLALSPLRAAKCVIQER
jgi:hypothetical protein